MNHPLEATSLMDWKGSNNTNEQQHMIPDRKEAPEENHNENRLANSSSVDTPNTSYFINTGQSPDDNFNSRQSLNNVPSIYNSVRKRDHLTRSYSVRDGVLIITERSYSSLLLVLWQ